VFGAGAGSCAAQAQAQPPHAASRGDKFREYAAQPCKGFADEANMVPGELPCCCCCCRCRRPSLLLLLLPLLVCLLCLSLNGSMPAGHLL
jgi:hypothetical protein